MLKCVLKNKLINKPPITIFEAENSRVAIWLQLPLTSSFDSPSKCFYFFLLQLLLIHYFHFARRLNPEVTGCIQYKIPSRCFAFQLCLSCSCSHKKIRYPLSTHFTVPPHTTPPQKNTNPHVPPKPSSNKQFIYLCICWRLEVKRTGSPQGFSVAQSLHK